MSFLTTGLCLLVFMYDCSAVDIMPKLKKNIFIERILNEDIRHDVITLTPFLFLDNNGKITKPPMQL